MEHASDPLDDLAPLLAQRRAELGLSLREASAQCGVPVATLSRVEQGRTPDLANFRRIVEWLGLPPERFLQATTRVVSTPDVISEHLRLDPTLSPDDAENFAELLVDMQEALETSADWD
jgi:transcriptional regulator with XRE-family HTH domain